MGLFIDAPYEVIKAMRDCDDCDPGGFDEPWPDGEEYNPGEGEEPITLAITIFTVGRSISNNILGAYYCYKWDECWEREQEIIARDLALWQNRYDNAQTEEELQTLLEMHPKLINTVTSSPCFELAAACGLKFVKAALWVAGRYVILKIKIVPGGIK